MKKSLVTSLIVTLISIASSGQNGFNFKYEVLDPNRAGKIFHNPITGADKPKGSPYHQPLFISAKVENVAQKALMRYNVYSDDFEFITAKNDTLILDKIDDFSNIVFSGTNKKYMLVNYTGSNGKSERGYLISFYDKGNLLLCKKENIRLYEGKVAKTSLEKDMPAKYVKTDDTYFLKIKDGAIVEFPDSKKQLVKLFPDKKQPIEAFLKEKTISFNEAADRIKIIDFLAAM